MAMALRRRSLTITGGGGEVMEATNRGVDVDGLTVMEEAPADAMLETRYPCEHQLLPSPLRKTLRGHELEN